jgi:hypothetical protein
MKLSECKPKSKIMWFSEGVLGHGEVRKSGTGHYNILLDNKKLLHLNQKDEVMPFDDVIYKKVQILLKEADDILKNYNKLINEYLYDSEKKWKN